MTSREFFYAVAEMRQLQKQYFETRDRRVFRACRAAENNVDREIRRVKAILVKAIMEQESTESPG